MNDHEEYMKNSKTKSVPLVEVNLLTGWKVYLNQFFDLPPPTESEKDIMIKGAKRTYDIYGELITEEYSYLKLFVDPLFGIHYIDAQDCIYAIELGWVPRHDPQGCYMMILAEHYDWQEPIIKHKTRDREEILEKLQEAMQWIIDKKEKEVQKN